MFSKRVVVLAVSLACLFALAPSVLFAQMAGTGSIVGTVTDPAGAAVVAATLTLTDTSTGTARTATTNETGRYAFSNIPPGTYDITINKDGFRLAKFSKQIVSVSETITLNVKMELGSVSQVVEVVAGAGAELQTTNSTVGTTIQHEELMSLPNLGRDATTLATLQPGTNINGNTAGAVVDQNTFQLDGGSITDDMSGDSNVYVLSFSSDTSGVGSYHSPGNNAAPSGAIPTPVESIEEFKVGVSNQTADFNQGAGGQVQMVTKRGTSVFHGAVYEYYTDNNFGGANTWDNNSTGSKQASAHNSRFGVSAGGPLLPFNFLGGKTYIFGNYEGYRNPVATTFERSYPSPLMRAGMLGFNGQLINLNPTATAVPAGMPAKFYTKYGVTAGQSIATTQCPGDATRGIPAGPCDPNGLGLNPVVANLWNTYLPLPNDYTHGDPSNFNYGGYKGNLSLPDTSNFGVARIDHDFGQKWHFNATYHYFKRIRTVTNQVDVGGFFPGDTKGQYQSVAARPQVPWYYTAGVTTNISSMLTNSFNYSGTRNWWAYASKGGVPNVAGYPAALELGGETSGSFQPYNTDNQNTRWRYWNGKDNLFRDDLTWIKSNHLVQFGGSYQRNNDTHERIDNGGFINIYEQYLIGQGNGTPLTGVDIGPYTPSFVTSTSKYGNLYSEVLGMVSVSQILYTRGTGTTLALNPRTSCAISSVSATSGCSASPAAINNSIIPTYNLYFSDSWRMKPSFTLTYGLGWTVEMPPYGVGGHQMVPVDANNNPLNTAAYLAARQSAALQGIAYDPAIGFSTIGNVNGHPKYPYNPFYGGFAPRLAAAWNPSFDDGLMGHLFGHGKTVIRGGWARVFGRLNGVDQVLVPILAPGLMQTVQCFGPTVSGTCGAPGGGQALAGTVWRVGVNGTTAPLAPASANLPQPWFPGVNDVATGAGEGLDPNFRPNQSDEFNLSIQRQLSPKVQIELGYIGRKITHEYQAYNLNAAPYMMTQGGQTFAKAWAAIMVATNSGASIPAALAAQPFFETALGGPKSAYCTGFANCTTAFATNNAGNMGIADVWSAWTSASNIGAWTFGRSMLNDPIAGANGANGQASSIFMNASNGYGNYNAAYFTLSFTNWHGLTMKTNLTYGKSLGTGAVVQASSAYTVVDPWNLHNMYGVQPYDERVSYNLYFNYDLPFYSSQKGVIGRILGGWSVAPLFVAGTGFPVEINTANGSCASFGEGSCNDESTYENAIALAPLNYSPTRKAGNNVFADPAAAFNLFRNPILGLDGQIGGGGPIYGLGFWNLDMSLTKNIKFTERFNTSLYFASTNLLNHMQPADPFFWLGDPSTFGVLGGGFSGAGNVQANTPRRMIFGLRFAF